MGQNRDESLRTDFIPSVIVTSLSLIGFLFINSASTISSSRASLFLLLSLAFSLLLLLSDFLFRLCFLRPRTKGDGSLSKEQMHSDLFL